MCRFFYLHDPTLFTQWADQAMTGYRKECKKNILSAGLIELNNHQGVIQQRSIPPVECLHTHFSLAPSTTQLFYHIRIPFDRKSNSVVLQNTHPFLLGGGRFVAMHNGLIHFRTPPPKNRTDSQHFFHLWLQYAQTLPLPQAFDKAKQETLPSSSMNLLLYDTQEKKLYLHRSTVAHELVPPLWVSPAGVSNFRVPQGKTIPKGKLLILPAVP